MPYFSLSWALLVSLLVHVVLFTASDVRVLFQIAPIAKFPTRLEARLVDVPPSQAQALEPLLKNTLSNDEVKKEVQRNSQKARVLSPVPGAVAKPSMPRVSRPIERQHANAVQKAQRKLSRHMYYPPEAIDQGWEGEVRLLLRLTEEGRILSVSVAASSGFPVLDQAALAAARAMGQIPEVGVKELLLPVIFRLQ